MVKRIYDVLAVVLILAGLGGMVVAVLFLHGQRFIEALVAGLLAFVLLRSGLLILRLMIARGSLDEAHRRIADRMGGGPGGIDRRQAG